MYTRLSSKVFGYLKVAIFLAALMPVARLMLLSSRQALGANPIEYITRSTGWWTLTFLLITLSVTPLRRLTDWHWLIRLRRMTGLFAFFYGALHFSTYLWLDQFFDWAGILKDIAKRPFITVGFAAFVLMLPLAVTSNNKIVRWLGARRWQRLHRAVYAIGVLGVLHFLWLVKKDVREPALFAMILASLFAVRIWFFWRQRQRPTTSKVRSQVTECS